MLTGITRRYIWLPTCTAVHVSVPSLSCATFCSRRTAVCQVVAPIQVLYAAFQLRQKWCVLNAWSFCICIFKALWVLPDYVTTDWLTLCSGGVGLNLSYFISKNSNHLPAMSREWSLFLFKGQLKFFWHIAPLNLKCLWPGDGCERSRGGTWCGGTSWGGWSWSHWRGSVSWSHWRCSMTGLNGLECSPLALKYKALSTEKYTKY